MDELQQLKDRISILEHYVSNFIRQNETTTLQGPNKAKKNSKSDKKKKDEDRFFQMRTVF